MNYNKLYQINCENIFDKREKKLQVIVRVALYKRKNKLLKYIAENLIYFLHVVLSKRNIELSKRNVELSKRNVELSKRNVELSKLNVVLSKRMSY